MNRILLEREEVGADGTARLDDARARHIRSVLRSTTGDELKIGVVDGPTGTGRVRSVGGPQVVLDCVFESAAPAREPLDLILALPRPKVLRRLIPQVAALGVDRLFLTNAWRVEKNFFSAQILQPEKLREGLLEGLRQSGRTRLPRVSTHRFLRRLVEEELGPPEEGTARRLAHPGAADRLGRWTPRSAGERLLLAVGPEGGWIDAERGLFARHGFREAGLGPGILRSDTACIALLAVARERLNIED
jgi:RsmE family RNA methyltransferase